MIQGMSRLLFPNQMKVDSAKKRPELAVASIIPVNPITNPSPLPHSSSVEATSRTGEATTNKIPTNTFSAVASNVNILDQIMNGMSQSQMSKNKGYGNKRHFIYLLYCSDGSKSLKFARIY